MVNDYIAIIILAISVICTCIGVIGGYLEIKKREKEIIKD